jgi:CDP-2,3-bis-(O-geranylgeranyl)-sn-glycerol synthase
VLLELKLLLLLCIANLAPVLARYALGERWGWPIDHGLLLKDGRPLFGPSKSWRGLAVAVLLTGLAAYSVGLPVWFGAVFAAASMLGDLVSSFTKRRLGKASSTRFPGLDQLPEALLPLIVGRAWLDYGWIEVIVLSLLFMLLDMLASPILFRLGIRRRPF